MSAKSSRQERGQTGSWRHWIRLVVAYLLIPLVLLMCGGDLLWWKAWRYSPLIVAAGIGGRIWAERRHPGLTAARQDARNFRSAKAWDKVLAPLMAVSAGYPLIIVAGLDHRYGWSPDFPVWLNVVGFILIAAGYAFASWAMAENRFFFATTIIRTDLGHRICDSGPYRIVRHPGYAGNILPLFGLVLPWVRSGPCCRRWQHCSSRLSEQHWKTGPYSKSYRVIGIMRAAFAIGWFPGYTKRMER